RRQRSQGEHHRPRRRRDRRIRQASGAARATQPLAHGRAGPRRSSLGDGGAEPTNLNADITVTQSDGFKGGTIVEELELWRNAGGKIDILMLAADKGP